MVTVKEKVVAAIKRYNEDENKPITIKEAAGYLIEAINNMDYEAFQVRKLDVFADVFIAKALLETCIEEDEE